MRLSEFLNSYEDFKAEILADIDDGILTMEDDIQILADGQGIILDWYYSDELQKGDLLERDEALSFAEQKELWKQYRKDKPLLKTIKVNKFIEIINKNLKYYKNIE